MALDFVAGCLGGCAGVLVGHPFDTVKVRLQTQNPAKRLYKGTFGCFRTIIAKESALGLYKGMASPLYGLALINAIVFGVQGNVQRRMANPDTLQSHFLAGATAGLVQCVVCSPMELAKTRMQIQGQGESRTQFKSTKHLYTGPIDCLKKIYKAHGIRGVFKGFTLTIVRETPSFGIYFATYEFLCRQMVEQPDDDVSMLGLLVAGGCSGMAAWIVTYPVDVIKSRIQADGANGPNQYKNAYDCFQKSIKAEGLGCLWTGLNSTLLRAFPVNAATFTVVALFLRSVRPSEDETMETISGHHHTQLGSEIHSVDRIAGAAASEI
ncbi:mitochondrial basic amino acids transporter-like [Lingula anatina]|uniref:Mitochondrial basic amino acids transporter n=1 Tax=Lingula anatina TaxID=7574 RepID=A0A1S3HH55_LINAN|nr:mitochondrial basic amino acids transporter-like [Lingula anatina]|eukprot:XP_013384816.1 mitochondrial basic amino acids transporter-like [Lingula anatina]